MDNKVIEVLDYMGEKLGIAIDWTSENVMPQVMEFMGRYQIYSIIYCVLWIIMSISIVTVCAIVLKKMAKGIMSDTYDNFWYELHNSSDGIPTICITIGTVLCIVFFGITAVENVFEIAKWAVIPEIQFIETFSEYLKSAS